MILYNKLEVVNTLKVGVIPTSPTSNLSVLFEKDSVVHKGTVGNIIFKNSNEFLPYVSTSFPSSVFNFNTSVTPTDPNMVVSFKNQVKGTVLMAPVSNNGTPAFRPIEDSDLSSTSIFTNSHTHTNKSVLDGITSTKVSTWDTVTSKANTDGGNITNIPQWLTNLGVYSTTQVDGFLAGKANIDGSNVTPNSSWNIIAEKVGNFGGDPLSNVNTMSTLSSGLVSLYGKHSNGFIYKFDSTALKEFLSLNNTNFHIVGPMIGGDSNNVLSNSSSTMYYLGLANNPWGSSQDVIGSISNFGGKDFGFDLASSPLYASTNPRLFARVYDNSTAGGWKRLLTEADVPAFALNLQQVTNNGNTSTRDAIFNNVAIGAQVDSYKGFDLDRDFSFLNGINKGRILTGGVLASDNYADASLIPANGGYFKGSIRTADTVQIGGGLFFDRPSEVQDWSVYQNSGGINFYVTGGSLTGDVFKIAENGRLTTLLDGTSADWNAKVSQSQLGNYVNKAGDTMTGALVNETGWYYGEVPIASFPKSHAIRLGGPGRDYMDFYEYGGVWNFYRSRGLTDDLLFNLQFGNSTLNSTLSIQNATAPNHAVTLEQLNSLGNTKVNSWENATAIGFTNGNASGLPYFYHSSGVFKYLTTVDYINAQGYTTEGWVLQQISNSASPYRYFQGNIFSDAPNFSSNTISGKSNQALGSYILHKGSRSTLIGDHIVSEGNYINTIGRRGSFSGGYLNSYGAFNTATGAHINLFGNYLTGSKSNYTAIGNYNKFDLLNPEKEQNKVVVIGSGKSEYERENAIEVFTDNSSGFRGKAFYDEETRNPEWFGEQGTLVDTTVAGMHHLEDRAISYNLDTVEKLIGVCDRGFGTTYYKSISGDEECLCPLGLVDGLNFSGGLFNPDKVHRTGTIKYNLQQSYVLSEKFGIGYGSAYLVVIYTEGDSFFESVRVLNYGDITRYNGMGQMCRILGSFIKVTTPEGPQVYFEFNHITLA